MTEPRATGPRPDETPLEAIDRCCDTLLQTIDHGTLTGERQAAIVAEIVEHAKALEASADLSASLLADEIDRQDNRGGETP